MWGEPHRVFQIKGFSEEAQSWLQFKGEWRITECSWWLKTPTWAEIILRIWLDLLRMYSARQSDFVKVQNFNLFDDHFPLLWLEITNAMLYLRRLTSDSALVTNFLKGELLPGDALIIGVLWAGDNKDMAGGIPERFLAGGAGMFCIVIGGFPSGGTAICRRTGKPSAHLL